MTQHPYPRWLQILASTLTDISLSEEIGGDLGRTMASALRDAARAMVNHLPDEHLHAGIALTEGDDTIEAATLLVERARRRTIYDEAANQTRKH